MAASCAWKVVPLVILALTHDQCDAVLLQPANCAMNASGTKRKAGFFARQRETSNWAMRAKAMSMMQDQPLQTIDDLRAAYSSIFAPSDNRNAASHLWAQYILSRQEKLTHDQIVNLFAGFCPVSGSPLGEPSANNRYRSTLDMASGDGTVTGFTYHCCWPCICDTVDQLKVDTHNVTDSSGTTQQYNFVVIGNPCGASDELPQGNPSVCSRPAEAMEEHCIPGEAPAVVCDGTSLRNAVLSDSEHIIIGMFFPESSAQEGQYVDYETQADEAGNTLKDACEQREQSGFNSGMGAIFQMVARINPIDV